MTRLKSPFLLAGASLLIIAGCTDPGQDGGSDNRRTQSGAIIGGLVGAATGAAVADNKAGGALVGGLLGAAGGAAIGNALDRQERELRESLRNDDIDITNTGDRLIVTMPQDILFAVDSAAVQSGLRSDLGRVAASLQNYPDTTVQVVGHTDSTGSAAYNQGLSERRANAVADVLRDNGVSYRRIRAFGRGEDQPVASNLTPEGRAQNRRVEIVILPNA
jgi:outer membrane protein OmpA-like peptidoglycan-associated protein